MSSPPSFPSSSSSPSTYRQRLLSGTEPEPSLTLLLAELVGYVPVTYTEATDVAYELRDFIEGDPRTSIDAPIPQDPTFKVYTLHDGPSTYELRAESNGSFAVYVSRPEGAEPSPERPDEPRYARFYSRDFVTHLRYPDFSVEANCYAGFVLIRDALTETLIYSDSEEINRAEVRWINRGDAESVVLTA